MGSVVSLDKIFQIIHSLNRANLHILGKSMQMSNFSSFLVVLWYLNVCFNHYHIFIVERFRSTLIEIGTMIFK